MFAYNALIGNTISVRYGAGMTYRNLLETKSLVVELRRHFE